jgi:hypothetical protein
VTCCWNKNVMASKALDRYLLKYAQHRHSTPSRISDTKPADYGAAVHQPIILQVRARSAVSSGQTGMVSVLTVGIQISHQQADCTMPGVTLS